MPGSRASTWTVGLALFCLSAAAGAQPGGAATPEEKVCLADPSSVDWQVHLEKLLANCPSLVRDEAAVSAGCKGKTSDLDLVLRFCKNPLDKGACVPDPAAMEYLEGRCDNRRDETAAGTRGAAGALAILSGGNLQDNIIRGLAAFLESRAKAEAMAALVSKLRDDLCGQEDAQACLPSTCTLALASDPYEQPVSWGLFKAAFEDDLNRLPRRIIERLIPAGGARAAALATFELLAEMLRNPHKISPQDLSAAFVATLAHQAMGSGLGSGADWSAPQVMALMGQAWTLWLAIDGKVVGAADISLGAKMVTRLTLDLLATEHPELRAALLDAGLSFEKALIELKQGRRVLADYVSGATGKFQGLKAKRGERKEWEPIAVDLASDTALCLIDLGDHLSAAAKAMLDVVAAVGAMDEDEKAAVALRLDRINGATRHVGQAIFFAAQQEYHRLFFELLALLNGTIGPENLPPWLKRFGPFLVEVARAESPEAVKAALESAAAPLGSFRYKRSGGRFFVTLNAYVGGVVGFEEVWDVNMPFGSRGRVGMFAPVGVEAGYAACDHFTIGAFMSVLDLGGLLSVGWGRNGAKETVAGEEMDKEVIDEPSYTFEQVFSPGIYLVMGLSHKVPLSLGLGAAISPMVHQVKIYDSSGIEDSTTDNTAFHVSAFLAIDLPIWIF